MTTVPADLLGIGATTGRVQAGMLANLVITNGDLFDKETKILETWVAGQQFVISPPQDIGVGRTRRSLEVFIQRRQATGQHRTELRAQGRCAQRFVGRTRKI